MDKYLTIILIFMVVGIPIAWISPLTGEVREQPLLPPPPVTKIKKKDKNLMKNERNLKNSF